MKSITLRQSGKSLVMSWLDLKGLSKSNMDGHIVFGQTNDKKNHENPSRNMITQNSCFDIMSPIHPAVWLQGKPSSTDELQ